MLGRLALTLVFISTLPAFGQHHLFRKVDVSLPSPECYRILQDNRGFVWIATEQGLCRYDGQHTRVYGRREGLPEKAVYALRKDAHGVIWLITKKGRVLHIRNNSIVDAGIGKHIGDPRFGHFPYDLFFQKKQVLIPVGFSPVIRLNRNDNRVTSVRNKQPTRPYVSVEHKEGQVVPLIIFRPPTKMPDKVTIRYTDRDIPSRSKTFDVQVDNTYSPQVITCKVNDRVFIGLCSRVVAIGAHGELKIVPVPNRILSMSADSRGGLWVGIQGYGVRYYANGDLSAPPVQSLPGLSVSNIIEDRERHIWCTTLEKGVYICRQPAMLAFNNFYGLHRPPDVLTAHGSELLISGRQDEVIVIDSLFRVKRLVLEGSLGTSITALTKKGDRWLIGFRELLQCGTGEQNRIVLQNRSDVVSQQGLQFDAWNGLTYVLGYSRIYSYANEQLHAETAVFSAQSRNFLVINPRKFLVFIPDQLQRITVENGKTHQRVLARPAETVSRLFMTRNKRVFILTKGEGLFELCGEKVVNRNHFLRIPTKVLNDIAEDGHGNLWIASNEGLLKLPSHAGGYGKPLLYDERHGFPSKVCDRLAIVGKTLAVSTTEGLVVFPSAHDLQPATTPGLSFHKAIVSGKPVRLRNAALHYDANSLALYFSVQSYHSNHGQLLRFTLDNGSTVQHGVSGPVLSLKNLDPGTYRLAVSGQNIFGVRSSRPLVITFTILPPFWLTWWFIVACLVAATAVLLSSFRWIRKRTERRLEISGNLKMQLAKSQLSTLQAQMNPHFLFNSISSIQNFIMSNKREEAYDYLTAFSKLIRRTLNNSRSQYISLAEEIETLKLYMGLEQRRYNHAFDFYLELGDAIVPENILLPASLIQPLLENAIWHGVAGINTERRGEILLRISAEEPDSLLVTVIDNGAGIQPSDTAHASLAIRLIEEHLSLLSGSSEKQPPPRVRLEPAENGHGTAVSFTLPILKPDENIISRR